MVCGIQILSQGKRAGWGWERGRGWGGGAGGDEGKAGHALGLLSEEPGPPHLTLKSLNGSVGAGKCSVSYSPSLGLSFLYQLNGKSNSTSLAALTRN